MFSLKSIVVTLVAIVVTGTVMWLILINPANPFTNLFRQQISDIDARIVIGPYPSERDFRLLKQNHIERVVSLLDPAIPYEASLLEREKELAGKYQLQLQNFPMSSILGQKLGDYYDDSASKAASAIEGTTGKVYLHCYLGLHRVQVVHDLLAARGIMAGKYAVRSGERDQASTLLDIADAAYNNGKYQNAIDILAKIEENQLTENARLLRAWSFYRTGDLKQAYNLFQMFISLSPDNPQGSLGLGYCAYRRDDYAAAERLFLRTLEKLPGNADALGGLGLTYYRAGRQVEAIAMIEAALTIAPGNQELRDILTRLKGTQ